MANVFDHARALAKALRESQEAQAMKGLGARVTKDAKAEQLLSEFRRRQFEIQMAAAQGKAPGKEESARMQKLVTQMQAFPVLADYLNAENAYGQLLGEVQKVLDEVFNPTVPGAVKMK